MKIESEYVPETAYLEITLEGREIRNISEQIEIALRSGILDPAFFDVSYYNFLKPFLQKVKKAIDNPKPKEDADKQGDK